MWRTKRNQYAVYYMDQRWAQLTELNKIPDGNDGKISEQNWLDGLQMIQFECPKH